MAYTDQYTLSKDTVFVGRAIIAMTKVALDVCAELDSTAGHQQREIFSVGVLRNNLGYDVRAQLVAGIVADVAISGASTDQNLYDRLSSIWNAFAGVV